MYRDSVLLFTTMKFWVTETHFQKTFPRIFWTSLRGTSPIFVSIYSCRRNFHPPLHSDERTVKQWVAKCEPATKSTKTVPLAVGKVMTDDDCFFGMAAEFCVSIIIKKVKKQGETLGDYYASLLDKLKTHLKKTLFHQNNAPALTSAIAMDKIHELIDHTPYSSDLAHCDFSLVSNLKICLRGQIFHLKRNYKQQ